MSFLRHARSIGPMGQVKTILRLKPCGASRWSAPGFAAGRDCNTAPSLIVRDEYAPAIPWRVALQQSLPPFHRMRPVCYESICRSRDFHRTASCVLTVCLGPGGHRIILSLLLAHSNGGNHTVVATMPMTATIPTTRRSPQRSMGTVMSAGPGAVAPQVPAARTERTQKYAYAQWIMWALFHAMDRLPDWRDLMRPNCQNQQAPKTNHQR